MTLRTVTAGLAALALLAACATRPAEPVGPPPGSARVLDLDGDGKVSLEEWEAYGDDLFAAIDADGDGALSEAEVATSYAVLDVDGDGLLEREELDFETLDTDGDGAVSPEEWQGALVFGSLDDDGDGAVSRAELRAARTGAFRAQDLDRNSSLQRVEMQHGRGFTVLRF